MRTIETKDERLLSYRDFFCFIHKKMYNLSNVTIYRILFLLIIFKWFNTVWEEKAHCQLNKKDVLSHYEQIFVCLNDFFLLYNDVKRATFLTVICIFAYCLHNFINCTPKKRWTNYCYITIHDNLLIRYFRFSPSSSFLIFF